jgi:hypothetical protein
MRIKPIVFIFAIAHLTCIAQDNKSCPNGIAEARANVAVGKLIILSYGLPANTKMSEEDYYSFRRHTIKEVMEEDYGITYDNDSSNVVVHDCYNVYMDSVIDARFGKNIDKKCKLKVDSLNAIEQQNALRFYMYWDLLIDSVCNSLSKPEHDSLTGTIAINMNIDTLANARNLTISESFNPSFEKSLTTLSNKIKWTPGTGIAGRKKESEGVLKMVFKKGKLDKFDAYFR